MMKAFRSENLNPRVGTEDDRWFRKGLLKTSSTCPSGVGMMCFFMWLVPTESKRMHAGSFISRGLGVLSLPMLQECRLPKWPYRRWTSNQSRNWTSLSPHLTTTTTTTTPALRPPWCTAERRVSRFKFVLHLAGRGSDSKARGSTLGLASNGKSARVCVCGREGRKTSTTLFFNPA